jgi:putative tryptophan/tyrosine transport system substrate-binding protein
MMTRLPLRGLLRAASILLMVGLLGAPVAAPRAQEAAISGTVTLDPSANSRLPTAPLLVITASKFEDRKKPPIIVKPIPDVTFPYAYTLTDDDITLVGSAFDGNLYLTARIETQNAAEGTLEGSAARNPVAVGSTGANIVIALHSKAGAAPAAVSAPGAGAKRLRIGLLWSGSTPFDPWSVPEGLRHAFREFGYVEGQDIVFEPRYAEGNYNRLPELAAELVALKVDLILAAGDSAAVQAAKAATNSTPIVMIALADTVRLGLVASLAQPGGNITGLSFPLVAIAAKQLELLKRSIPRVSRAAVLWNPANPAHALVLKGIESAARFLNVELEPVAIGSPSDFGEAFTVIQQARADAALVLWDPMLYAHGGQLTLLALQNRLPTISAYREFAEAAGLLAYGPRLSDIFLGGASYADKIVRGARPADLPVEQPVRFELAVNAATAKALGLTIPQSILVRADKVFR